jgi:hypothetical protein
MVPLTCDAFTWALVTDLKDVENPFLSEPFKSTDVNPSANEVSGFLSHTFPCFVYPSCLANSAHACELCVRGCDQRRCFGRLRKSAGGVYEAHGDKSRNAESWARAGEQEREQSLLASF